VHGQGRRLVLASVSPRRAWLLRSAGIDFSVVDPGQVEGRLGADGAEPKTVAMENARAKARSVAAGQSDAVVLGCDTVVVVGGAILGKPRTAQEAASMLRSLSGRWHSVISGVCIVDARSKGEVVGTEESRVRFARLDEESIQRYVATGEPFDKAGAYAIQGAASSFVIGLRGPLDNVIGLPVGLVRRMLQQMKVTVGKD